jgi:Ca2+/Na+ antiporter
VFIFLGLFGIITIIMKQKKHYNIDVIYLSAAFFIVWYSVICFGDTYHLRNIEMRYLFQTDVLLILPAAYLLHQWSLWMCSKKTNNGEG